MRRMTVEQAMNPEDQDQRMLVALIDFIKDEFASVNSSREAMRLIQTVIRNLDENERKVKDRTELLMKVFKIIHDYVFEIKNNKIKQKERELYADSVRKCLDLGMMMGGLPIKGDKTKHEEMLIVDDEREPTLEDFLNSIGPDDLSEN